MIGGNLSHYEVLEELANVPNGSLPEIEISALPDTWVPETLVYQVFVNLIGNACHYAASAAEPIEIGCWQEPKRQVYYVRDHGRGVPAGEREKIFDIFYRGKAVKGTRGTGVGLAIVRKIALRCSGAAWVEDTPGGGATFCISFPTKPGIAAAPDDFA